MTPLWKASDPGKETKAGFEYVPKPIPVRNSRGAVIDYLFFASHNKTGGKIAKGIFKKYSDQRILHVS